MSALPSATPATPAQKPVLAPDAVFCRQRPSPRPSPKGEGEEAIKGEGEEASGAAGPLLYFFKDARYFCWDVVEERVRPGYPRDIEADWPGLAGRFPGCRMRGALHVPEWGDKVYFLFESQPLAVAWDLARGSADAEPVDLRKLLPGAPQDDFTPVHAQLADGTPVIYAFQKFDYWRWTLGGGPLAGPDAGFPRRIEHDWKDGLVLAPRAGVYVDWPSRSAAHSNRKIYFFMGNLYLRWDVPSGTRNYRLDVLAGWKGWPMP